MFWSLLYLQVHECFGGKWWFCCILEINEKNPYLTIEPVQSSTFRDKHWSTHIMCCRSTEKCARPGCGFSRFKSKSQYNYRITAVAFNLVFMCCAIDIGNTRFLIFSFSQQTILRVFSRFGEMIQDSFRDLYWNSSISNLNLFMHFI